MKSDVPIENAVNIGKVLAQRLRSVEIPTLQVLKEVGDAEAFARIARVHPDACLSERLALAGAVHGMRWHLLPPEIKEAAKNGVLP